MAAGRWVAGDVKGERMQVAKLVEKVGKYDITSTGRQWCVLSPDGWEVAACVDLDSARSVAAVLTAVAV